MIAEEIEKVVLQVCLRICKRGEGALIVVGEADYKVLVEQKVIPFYISENPKLLESLCLMDGAVVINTDGFLKAYGVKIKSPLVWKNFGTRTSAGYSASMKEGTIAYVVSQEDTRVRIFKSGKLIMEVDGKLKDIEKKIPEVSKIIESIGYGTLGVIGASVLTPVIGIIAIPGITVFVAVTGITYFLRKAKEDGLIK